jgi:hypothetical protein
MTKTTKLFYFLAVAFLILGLAGSGLTGLLNAAGIIVSYALAALWLTFLCVMAQKAWRWVRSKPDDDSALFNKGYSYATEELGKGTDAEVLEIQADAPDRNAFDSGIDAALRDSRIAR